MYNPLMTWQLLVTISIISNAISAILLRVLLKKENSHAIAFSIMYQLITGSLIFLYALYGGFRLPNLYPFLPLIFLIYIGYIIGNICAFNALKIIGISEYKIIYSIRPVVTVLASILFLGEIINFRQIIGAILILIGVIVVSWQSKKLKILNQGAIYTLIAATAYGLAFTGDTFVVRNLDVASYQTFAFIIPATIMLTIFPSAKPHIKKMFNFSILPKLFILCVFQAIATITVFLGYKIGRNNVQIAPLGQLSTIVIVLAGIIILKERKNLFQRILGTILSFSGAIMLR
jgi:drug/metabolite transporter (DMT)-like permease